MGRRLSKHHTGLQVEAAEPAPKRAVPSRLAYVDTSAPDILASDTVDLSQMQSRQKEMMKDLTAYSTTAIPKEVTELQYQRAV